MICPIDPCVDDSDTSTSLTLGNDDQMVHIYAKVQEMKTARLFMKVTFTEMFCGIFPKYRLLIVPSYTPLVTGQSVTKVPQSAGQQTSDPSYRYEACLVQCSPSGWT